MLSRLTHAYGFGVALLRARELGLAHNLLQWAQMAKAQGGSASLGQSRASFQERDENKSSHYPAERQGQTMGRAQQTSDSGDLTGRASHAEPRDHWVLRLLDRLPLERRTIFSDDRVSPYLTRFYVSPDKPWWRRRLPGVFLHWFHRSDADRELHCHPWRWSVSLVLAGGYVEERLGSGLDFRVVRTVISERLPILSRRFRPGTINVLYEDTFHRVTLIDPRGALTLFIAGPKVGIPDDSSWGFLSRDGTTYETVGEREDRLNRSRPR